MATRQVITQLASTTDEGLLRFRLQMAEQSRRFGERLKELREERRWKQKDVVAAMAKAGDLALNTNQLSRYENGGAYPNETRMQRFAEIFDVDFADLIAPQPAKGNGDLMDSLTDAEAPSLKRVEDQIALARAEQARDMEALHKELKALRKSLEPVSRKRKGSRR